MKWHDETANIGDLLEIVGNTEDKFKLKINKILDHLKDQYRYLLDLKADYTNNINSFTGRIRLGATGENGITHYYDQIITEEALAYNTDAVLYEYIRRGLEELNMAIYGGYGGSGGSGHYVTTSGSGSSINGYQGYMPYSGSPIASYNQTQQEREQEEKEAKARDKIEISRIKQAKKDFTLADISSIERETMLDTLHETLKMYNYKKGADNMTKGIKWLLFFLGFAILLNFGKILDIITLVVN